MKNINSYLILGLTILLLSALNEKYKSNMVCPETVINKYIDENWRLLLQTSPFHEYMSAHSVVSACSA